MLFNSVEFLLIFLPTVFVVFFLIAIGIGGSHS